MDTTFAPFEFEDSQGNRVGIDVELLEAIAKDQGFEYEARAIGFDAALQAVESGQADGIFGRLFHYGRAPKEDGFFHPLL